MKFLRILNVGARGQIQCLRVFSGKRWPCVTGDIKQAGNTMEALVFDGTALKLTHQKDFPMPKISSDDDVIVKIEYAAGLAEPFSCVVHAMNRAAPLRIGLKILILGAGIIGNLFASTLHHHGHRNVTVAETQKARLKIVEKLDTGFQLIHPDVLAKNCLCYDVILDTTGVGKVMEVCMNNIKPGGKYIVFGCCPPDHATMINPYIIFEKELTIIGVKINPFTFLTAIHWLEAMGCRYVCYEKLGVKTYRLSEYQNALKDVQTGKVAKALFKVGDDDETKKRCP